MVINRKHTFKLLCVIISILTASCSFNSIDVKNMTTFMKGFLDGSDFDDNFRSLGDCQVAVNDLRDLFFTLIDDFSKIKDIDIGKLFDIANDIGNSLRTLSKSITNCTDIPRESKEAALNIYNFIVNKQYPLLLMKETTLHSVTLLHYFTKTKIYLEHNNQYQAGYNCGIFTQYLIFFYSNKFSKGKKISFYDCLKKSLMKQQSPNMETNKSFLSNEYILESSSEDFYEKEYKECLEIHP